MILLDTDSFTLFAIGHPRVAARFIGATDDVMLPIVTYIEALQGRFAFLMRAADRSQLLLAQARLQQTETDLARFPVIGFNEASAGEFDRLLQNKRLKKIGRGDLLIAAISLANRAILVSRNLKDFHQVPGLQVENWAD